MCSPESTVLRRIGCACALAISRMVLCSTVLLFVSVYATQIAKAACCERLHVAYTISKFLRCGGALYASSTCTKRM